MAIEAPEKPDTKKITFVIVDSKDSFSPVRKTQDNPLIDALMQAYKEGKSVFYPGGEEERLNSLYEAARRRNLKCKLEKGEIDGVLGYLITFYKPKSDDTNGIK